MLLMIVIAFVLLCLVFFQIPIFPILFCLYYTKAELFELFFFNGNIVLV